MRARILVVTIACLGLAQAGCASTDPVIWDAAADAPAPDAASVTRPADAALPEPDLAPPPPTLFVDLGAGPTTFADAIEVTMVTDDPTATIRYTTDDALPTEAAVAYRSPVRLTASTTVRAVAVTGARRGPVASRSFLKVAADAAPFSSNLPLLLLHTAGARPTTKAHGKRPGSLNVFEPGPDGRATLHRQPALNSRVGVRVRGSSSERWEKKSYKVELWRPDANDDRKLPLLGLGADGDWILVGPYTYDRAFLRNPLLYAISNQLGRWAPRTRFVEVFFSDAGRAVSSADYMGVYVLTEKIEPGKHRLPITQLGPDDTAEPAVTGGYVIKVDRLSTGEKGIPAGFGPGNVWGSPCPPGQIGSCGINDRWSIGTLAYHAPDEATILMTPAQVAYLSAQLDGFANALAAKGDYGSFIDTPTWIDHHILKAFAKDMDALRLSSFFHKDRGGKLSAGPVWDFDRTMGCTVDVRCPDPNVWSALGQGDDHANLFYYGWWRGLFADPRFKAAYFDRFRELLGKQLSVAHLHSLVDTLAAELGPEAPARNFQRWPKDAPPEGHAREVTRLKDWLAARVRWLTTCLTRPDPMLCKGANP